MNSQEIYKMLRELRIKRNITQSEIAEYMSIDVSTFSLYESGKRNLPTDILNNWLNYFDLKLGVVETGAVDIVKLVNTDELKKYKKIKSDYLSICDFLQKALLFELKEHFTDEFFIAREDMYTLALIDEANYTNRGNIITIHHENTVFQFNEYGMYGGTFLKKDDLFHNQNILKEILDDIQKTEGTKLQAILKAEKYAPEHYSIDFGTSGYFLDSLVEVSKKNYKYTSILNEFFLKDEIRKWTNTLNEIEKDIDDLVEKNRLSDMQFHPEFLPFSEIDNFEVRIYHPQFVKRLLKIEDEV